jgi:formylglycine-generating enzyme required for sulfatase activity
MGNNSPKPSPEDYLENLALSQDEKDKIAALAPTGPAALLAMMQAAPEDFYRYLGRERCAVLRERLQRSLSRSERATLDAPVWKFHATGARLDQEAPSLRPPQYDVAERNRLFEELQFLRRRVAEIEQRLNAMLEASPEPVKVAACALPQLAASFVNSIGMEFVLVSAGTFQMGSNAYDWEKPIHEVTIAAPFYLGKYQVTQGEWTAVMGDNPSRFPSWFERDDRFPVENVSWDDCQEFIKRLNARKDGYVYRLPSEAEWEYACRAGTTTPFSFGETLTAAQANYNGDYPYGDGPKGEYRKKTTRVGSFPPNAWGLHDMHGNVWEWCQDVWHGNYDGAPTDGSAWEAGSDNLRVVRGGSWCSNANYCRSANRFYSAPGLRFSSNGFRLVAARIP